MKTAKYRVETGCLYVYSQEHHAYLFAVALLGRSKRQAIRDYEALCAREETE